MRSSAATTASPLKPAPGRVIAVCHAFRTEPARVAVIGDTPADMAMARAAGAGLVVGRAQRHRLGRRISPLADVVIDSVAALLD